MVVPKPGSAKFRFTVDLRPVNLYTVRYHFPMLNVEQGLIKLADSKYYATFDLSHGYWQFELDEPPRECQSCIMPDEVYTPTCVLHGTTNAKMYIQSTLADLFSDSLLRHALDWLDDILLHSSSVDGLIVNVRTLLKLIAAHNSRLHPSKCALFAQEITWCGRVISSSGIQLALNRIDDGEAK